MSAEQRRTSPNLVWDLHALKGVLRRRVSKIRVRRLQLVARLGEARASRRARLAAEARDRLEGELRRKAAALEKARFARAARRATEAGPHFPPGHWFVLQTLAACACVAVALVTALEATSGVVGGALVGAIATALCLAGVVVSDVTDLRAGMYTADRGLAPALARLRLLLASISAAQA